jgi:hypothetical protein
VGAPDQADSGNAAASFSSFSVHLLYETLQRVNPAWSIVFT